MQARLAHSIYPELRAELAQADEAVVVAAAGGAAGLRLLVFPSGRRVLTLSWAGVEWQVGTWDVRYSSERRRVSHGRHPVFITALVEGGTAVAVKQYELSHADVRRAQREVRALAQLAHPSIVKLQVCCARAVALPRAECLGRGGST